MSDLIFRPMLACDAPEDLTTLDYTSLFMGQKLDGVRARNIDGKLYSRSGELIPNQQLQLMYGRQQYHLLDGEIWWPGSKPNEVQSFVSSADAYCNTPFWYIFDFATALPYIERRKVLACQSFHDSNVVIHKDIQVYNAEEVQRIHAGWKAAGLEGSILRDGRMHYKFGRSTVSEQALLRIKEWETFEGTITGWGPRMVNDNDQERSAIGYAKRSKSKDGMLELDEVGYFEIKANWQGKVVRFSVGASPLGRAMCKKLWQLGLSAVFRKTATIKAAKDRAKDLPSQPILVCLRWEGDL